MEVSNTKGATGKPVKRLLIAALGFVQIQLFLAGPTICVLDSR
jgi:hypothetical protein